MNKFMIVGVVAAMIVATPVFAATTSFYVAQNAKDKTCSVIQAKPDGKTLMMVGTATYKTKAEADAALKAAAACKK